MEWHDPGLRRGPGITEKGEPFYGRQTIEALIEKLLKERIAVADPKVEQPTLQRLYLVPSCLTATDKDCYALELLAEVLGGGPTSHLYRKLVLERGIAVNAGAWYMSSAIDETRYLRAFLFRVTDG